MVICLKRQLTTSVGSVTVKIPRNLGRGEKADKINYDSKIVPKHLRRSASMQKIYMAEDRATAKKMLKKFLGRYGNKYPKAAECILKDGGSLLAFYDFPAVHWIHIRTTNPIGFTFAT